MSGITTLNGNLALHCFGNCVLNVNDELTILNGTGNLLGEYSAVTYFGFATGAFEVIYDRVNEDVILRVLTATSPIPLPAAAWFLAGGLGALVARRQRRWTEVFSWRGRRNRRGSSGRVDGRDRIAQ